MKIFLALHGIENRLYRLIKKRNNFFTKYLHSCFVIARSGLLCVCNDNEPVRFFKIHKDLQVKLYYAIQKL